LSNLTISNDEKQYFDAIIVVPLEEEFNIVTDCFETVEDASNDHFLRLEVAIPECKTRFLLVKQSTMGKTANREALEECLNDYDAGILICVGIAGGISGDVKLGDVCYSGTIIDVTDNAKVGVDRTQKESLALSTRSYSTPREITIPIMRDRLSPLSKTAYVKWTEACASRARELIPGDFMGRKGLKEQIAIPSAREGVIVCGLVSSSPEYNKKLQGVDRKVLAVETEAGGMSSIAEARNIPAITIRGISDYAGIDKNEFEHDTNNQARNVAVYNAASFLARQLATLVMVAQFGKIRARAKHGNHQLSLIPETAADQVGDLLIRLASECDDRLRDLAPGYSLKIKGYRLPVPRIRMLGRTQIPDQIGGEPIEIRDALRETRVLALHIPRDYPDLSLAWIIASDLISVQVEDAQILPTVIEAGNIQRPRRGILDLASGEVRDLINSPQTMALFIIDEFPFNSKSKTEFLKSQVESLPNAKFIILTRSNNSAGEISEFSTAVAGLSARLCDISFNEISHFIQKNFDMAPPASQVVALRLRETFNKFRLPAHPSYIAGIPRDVLNALLQANRRAELLEIAVAGYLSFVVADDREPIALSRKTREKFLSELVFSIRAEGKSFSETELTSYTEKFARRYDFNITPIRFIATFMEKGILYFEEEKVRFTLPFMEAYLLAKRLTESESDALQYYDIKADGFDYPTFTLYAELGASSQLVSKVLTSMDESLAELNEGKAEGFILFQSSISPALLERHGRLQSIQRRLQQAEADVRNDRDQSKEKQRILDVSDRVRESTAAKIEEARDQQIGPQGITSATVQGRAVSIWTIALSLLGSGAERLEAGVKRDLVRLIVALAVAIIDGGTRDTSGINFSNFENDLLNDQNLLQQISKSESEKDRKDAVKFLREIVEFFEYIIIMQPFLTTMASICEEARDDVLAESILKADIVGDANVLVRNLWLSDINVDKGKSDLSKSVKKLPKLKLIRSMVMSHLMMRVYWKQWKKQDRIELLTIGKESLRGIGMDYKVEDMEKILGALPSDS
jgi:nucleoside phosphorylase